MTADALVTALQHQLDSHRDGGLCVGFSGGPDSSALLHALAALPQARARDLRAVHVDHGLVPESRQWAAHCQAFCERIRVPLRICRVEVQQLSGTGPEAAARSARYTAFASLLAPGESLLTAHHREDQVETVLLKWLRGAGPEGLGGMRVRRPFAKGWLWRPLLEMPRRTLLDYLRRHAIGVIHDPSNDSTRYARNFLRLEILPRLSERWPEAAQAILHGARLSREAADYLDARSREALAALRHGDDHSLDARGWLELHAALRGPVLDQWLHAQDLPAPTLAQRDQLQRQARDAAADRVPLVRWPGATVHVWRGRLHAHPPLPDVPAAWKATWRGGILSLPAAAGTLRWAGTGTADSTAPALEVRLGETGVHLRPAGDRHTRELRILFQQAGMVPWRRRRCPLIYDADGTLLAVADLWQTDAGKSLFTRLGVKPDWHPAA